MKKVFASGLLCLTVGFAMAQPETKKKEEVEIEINGSTITIEADDLEKLSEVDLNTIIREVTERSIQIQRQQQELLAQVDKQLANSEISEEQADEMREMINEHTEESMEVIGELMEAWGENYGERMEVWAEEYEASMEEWEAEVEKRAEAGNFVMPPLPPMPPMPQSPPAKKSQKIIINEDGIIIQKGDDGEEPFALKFDDEDDDSDAPSNEPKSIDRTNGYFDINWGFNQQLAGGESFITDGPEELDFWRSHEFNFGFGGKTRVGSPYSKFYVKWGGEFSFHGFRLLGNNSLQRGPNDDAVIQMDSGKAIDKSKYNIAYFNVPVMLQLDFSDVGEIDESFTLGVGGYAGVRLGAKRVLHYSTAQYNDIDEDIKGDFNTNQFRYGVMAQIGWDAFKLTAKYDLNSFFKDGKGPDYQMASLTFGFTL